MKKLPLFLAAAFLIAVAGAWYLARTDAPQQGAVFEPLSEVLQQSINEVRKVTVRGSGEELVLEGYGGDWKVANRENYPALFGKVKTMLITLSETRIVEYKTSNPELYGRLGLQQPDEEGARSHQVIVEDGTGRVLLDVLIGDRSTGPIGGQYARKSEDARSFLTDSELTIDVRMRDWLDAELADIDADRVQEILIRQGGEQPLRIFRESLDEREFIIADIPEGKKVKSQTTLDRMGTILAALRAEDVRGKGDFSFSDAAARTMVRTFDGLVADITAEYIDGVSYAAMVFSADEEAIKAAVIAEGEAEESETEEGGLDDSSEYDARLDKTRKEAARLNAKFDDWVYEVPYFKYDMFDRKPGGLLDDAEQASDEVSDDAAAPAP